MHCSKYGKGGYCGVVGGGYIWEVKILESGIVLVLNYVTDQVRY